MFTTNCGSSLHQDLVYHAVVHHLVSAPMGHLQAGFSRLVALICHDRWLSNERSGRRLKAVLTAMQIFIVSSEKIRLRGYETLYTYSVSNPKSALSRFVFSVNPQWQVRTSVHCMRASLAWCMKFLTGLALCNCYAAWLCMSEVHLEMFNVPRAAWYTAL